MPGAVWLTPVAFIIANLIIYWSGIQVLWKLGVCIVIGYILIGISMAFDKERPPLDIKSALWLPVYLIGMGIISWNGQYNGAGDAKPLATGHLHFGIDMLVVAVFALIIYYWAQASKLPKEEMLVLVEKQAAHGGADAAAH